MSNELSERIAREAVTEWIEHELDDSLGNDEVVFSISQRDDLVQRITERFAPYLALQTRTAEGGDALATGHGNYSAQDLLETARDASPQPATWQGIAPQMDWGQVAANGGPPCFFVEGPQFCGRAELWQGHGNPAFHGFISLDCYVRLMCEKAALPAPPETEPLKGKTSDAKTM